MPRCYQYVTILHRTYADLMTGLADKVRKDWPLDKDERAIIAAALLRAAATPVPDPRHHQATTTPDRDFPAEKEKT